MSEEVNKILEDLSPDKECLVHNYIINLINENINLKQELNQRDEVIDEAIEYIEKYNNYNAIPYELYEILKENKLANGGNVNE